MDDSHPEDEVAIQDPEDSPKKLSGSPKKSSKRQKKSMDTTFRSEDYDICDDWTPKSREDSQVTDEGKKKLKIEFQPDEVVKNKIEDSPKLSGTSKKKKEESPNKTSRSEDFDSCDSSEDWTPKPVKDSPDKGLDKETDVPYLISNSPANDKFMENVSRSTDLKSGQLQEMLNLCVEIQMCLACSEAHSELQLCSACLSVGYCNQTCQEDNWEVHLKFCKKLKSLAGTKKKSKRAPGKSMEKVLLMHLQESFENLKGHEHKFNLRSSNNSGAGDTLNSQSATPSQAEAEPKGSGDRPSQSQPVLKDEDSDTESNILVGSDAKSRRESGDGQPASSPDMFAASDNDDVSEKESSTKDCSSESSVHLGQGY